MQIPEQFVVTPITDDCESGAIFKMECEFNPKALHNCNVFTSHKEACTYLRGKLEHPSKGLTKEDLDDFFTDSIESIIHRGNRHIIMVDGKESPHKEIPAEKDIERPPGFPTDQGIGIEDFLNHYPLHFFGESF